MTTGREGKGLEFYPPEKHTVKYSIRDKQAYTVILSLERLRDEEDVSNYVKLSLLILWRRVLLLSKQPTKPI